MAALPLAKRARTSTVFVDTEKVERFEAQHIVSVDGPWRVLLGHLESESIALIRAPPKSGKSLLGKLAAAGRVDVLKEKYEVRYVDKLSNVKAEKFGYKDVEDMAKDSGASWAVADRKSIIYYFDETDEIPEAVNTYFISSKCGYAVFASTGTAQHPKSNETPKALVQHTFHYRSPADRGKVHEWLTGRIKALFAEGANQRQCHMASELLMNLSGGHVGIVQFVGAELERRRCGDMDAVRSSLAAMLEDGTISSERCFGVGNGFPNDEQCRLISMVRCTGATVMSPGGEAFSLSQTSHRHGLSQAFYAPVCTCESPIAKVGHGIVQCSFVHTLQPEIYESKFKVATDWRKVSLSSRWVVDFAHSDRLEVAKTPTNVVDLVVSWLSHISTEDLMYAEGHVDPAETIYQMSFHKFHKNECGLDGRREEPAHGGDGTFSGYLDHLVDSSMGVEFLIRTTAENRFNATELLTGETKKSLIEHASRAVGKYDQIAAKCTRGYITVLPATVTTTTAETEYGHFKELITALRERKADAPILKHNIMVAVATFGWAMWDVFLWDPALGQCVRFEIKRQRLMYKIVDGKAVIARHFYPRPTEVWARELLVEGDGSMKVTGKAFEVQPEKDTVASLAKGIAVQQGYVPASGSQLTIYSPSRTGVWREIETQSQVLYENTEAKPYGFVVPRAAV